KSQTAKFATMIETLTIGKRRAGIPSESGSTREVSQIIATARTGHPQRPGRELGSISAGRRVLDLPHAKREHDIPDAANDGDRRHPRDQKNRTAAVVASRPEPEHELDDAADQLQPPDLELTPRGDRDDE